MDENKHPQDSEASRKQTVNGAEAPQDKAAVAVNHRRIFSKRWVYPALYLGAAAVIIGLMYIKSQNSTQPASSNGVDMNTITSPTVSNGYVWPVQTGVTPKVTMGYFEDRGTPAQQASALVEFDNGFYPHKGYDIKTQAGGQFDVAAAADGKVSNVRNDKLMGLTVEITSNDGNIERYQSLSKASVNVGDTVTQGQMIGVSGTSTMEQSQGDHLFFQVVKDGQPVNPATVLPPNQAAMAPSTSSSSTSSSSSQDMSGSASTSGAGSTSGSGSATAQTSSANTASGQASTTGQATSSTTSGN